jgi:hypothetical protein
MTNARRGLILSLTFVGVFGSANAQAGAQDPRVPAKLDAKSATAFNAVIDSAKAQGLPTKPLEDKMYEGIAKGADGARIVASVRSLYVDMVAVRNVLGAVASTDELKAAALAMQAGVSPVELGKLKKSRGLLRSLALPLTVTADLVSRGVPVSTAINAVKSLVGAGAKDKDLNDFQRNVKDDIQQGAPPAAAAETRAKGATSNGKTEKEKEKSEKPEQQQDTIKL